MKRSEFDFSEEYKKQLENESLPFVDYDVDVIALPNTKYKMSVRWCGKFRILDLHEDEFTNEILKKKCICNEDN